MKKIIITVLFFVVIGCDNCDQQGENTSSDIVFTSFRDDSVAIGNIFDPSSFYQTDILINSKIYDINSDKILFVTESDTYDTLKISEVGGNNIEELFIEFDIFNVNEPRINQNSSLAFFRSGSDIYSLNINVKSLSLVASNVSSSFRYKLLENSYLLIISETEEVLTIIETNGNQINSFDISEFEINSELSASLIAQKFIFLANKNDVKVLTVWDFNTGLQETVLVESSISNAIILDNQIVLFDEDGKIYSMLDQTIDLLSDIEIGKVTFADWSPIYNTIQLSVEQEFETDLYYFDLETNQLELITNNGFRAFRN